MSIVEITQNSVEETRKTITVPEAGRRYFNVCRKTAYEAVARGEIPVVRIGRLMRVPVAALERMMAEAGKAEASK